jgi:DNA sulfur modification protein DndD
MIIDELVLHNVGVYAGEQHLALTPPPGRPVTLFGGLNGVGKTTLLDSLQLALYGKLAEPSRRSKRSYSDFLESRISRSARNREARIELSFRTSDAPDAVPHRLIRAWHANGKGAKESFEVIVGDKTDRVLTETWLDYVESMIPRRMAELFFFDGERIEQFADIENSRSLLRAAVHTLLGVEVVDDLHKDLAVLRRRKLKASASDAARSEMESLSSDVAEYEDKLALLDQELAELNNRRDAAERSVETNRMRYEAEGGGLADRRSAVEQERASVADDINRTEESLRELAAGCTPLALVADQLDMVRQQALREQEASAALAATSFLEERDATCIELLTELRAQDATVSALATHLGKDRDDRLQAASIESYLQLSQDAQVSLAGLIDERLPNAVRSSKALVEQHEKLTEQLQNLDRSIANMPTDERLQGIRAAVASAETELLQAEAATMAIGADRDRVAAELDRRRTKLEAALTEIAAVLKHSDSAQRVASYAEKAQTTLDRFRSQLVRRRVGRVEELVLDCYKRLLRKKSLVHELRIDPDDFTTSLLQKNGHHVDPSELSAGERQLLAVSLLWGLARASERPLPTVIDTPLGRLDSAHRSHLVDRYFPEASHQVLLLSTDEEISKDHYDRLSDHIGHEYSLAFDERTQSTTVEEGFFWS